MPGALHYVKDPVSGEWIPALADATGQLSVAVGSIALPADAATETTLALVETAVDGVEGLLNGGLPAALDAGALKIKEQSPITGFATETTLALVETAVDGVETLLAGGLPVALDGVSLKVKEQSPITGFATETTLAKTIPAATPTIYNVTMTNANTEYSQALPASTKKFLIHTRVGEAFRLAFETGKVATPTAPYFSITPSDAYSEDLVLSSAITLYFASATAGAVAEIITWS